MVWMPANTIKKTKVELWKMTSRRSKPWSSARNKVGQSLVAGACFAEPGGLRPSTVNQMTKQ
jgi:hypothetical protein